MRESIHITTKKSLLKYKVVLLNKYTFVPCENTSKCNQLLLGVLQETCYIIKYIRKHVRIFVQIC